MEDSLRALDDDTHAPVLINPSVTRDAFSPSGFPARHWAVLFVFFSPQQTLVNSLSNVRRRGGGKVESVLCFPSAASFPRPSCRQQLAQRLMSVVSAAGQYGPCNPRQFVGDRHYDLVAGSTLCQSMHPLPEPSGVVLDTKQYRAGTMDQHATQIDIPAF